MKEIGGHGASRLFPPYGVRKTAALTQAAVIAARVCATSCMSQTRLNDEAKNRDDQADAKRRGDIEFRRPVASETKRSVHLPHGLVLEQVARFFFKLSLRALITMRRAARRIHWTNGQPH